MASCHYCGVPIPAELEIHRTTVCASCGNDLKICKNCEFYSPGAHWDCRETIPDPVLDKERANFCDHFRRSSEARGPANRSSHDKARSQFDSLFGHEQ